MNRFFAVLFLFLVLANFAYADCTVNRDLLAATYKVTTIQTEDRVGTTRHIVLWRNGRQVAHEYLDTHITEVWEHMNNGMVRLVRNFDEHKRGIEYQPDEIKNRAGNDNWSLKHQLLSNDLINSMEYTTTKGEGCDKVVSYVLNNGNTKVELEWLVHQSLVKKLTEESPSGRIAWELEKLVIDQQAVKQAFTLRSDYQTTDYADIGDNESDPFLMQMINLGFIEHGASGFYDEHGHALEGGHSH